MTLLYKKMLLGLSAMTLIGLGGCKKFRDVNTNPNSPEKVGVQFILPSAQAGIAQYLGGNYQIIGGMWSQYWTQTTNASQYQVYDQYLITGAETDRSWTGIYAGALMDLEKVIETAGVQKNYAAIAKILKGYTYQMMTDQYGDIPFSEALGGESKDITSPHYDSQEMVYNGIIALVKEGMDGLDPNSPPPGSDDLIYHGDLNAWQVFGNTLLLKMYLRLAYRSPSVAQQGIAALYANGIGFIGVGGTAKIVYGSQAGSFNPLFSEMNNSVISRTQNLIASSTAIDSFVANGDPRVQIFYAPGSGGYIGNRQGDYNSAASAPSFAFPSAAVGGSANDDASAVAPVIFMSDYESLFLQAEAALRGWGSGNPQSLYEQAIMASFKGYASTFASLQSDGTFPTLVVDSMATSDTTGIEKLISYTPEYAANTYMHGDASVINDTTYYLGGEQVTPTPPSYWGQYPAGGSFDDKLRFIITQKWFSLCGNQNIEAWTEWRRTGYPNFFVISKNTRLGQGLFPQRIPYPNREVVNNLNFPGQKQVTDKVWWDVN